MGRIAAVSLALAFFVLFGIGVAHDHAPSPEHPHMLVLGIELDGETPVSYRKCVDLAAGQALPLKAHHDHLHTGRAGLAQSRAGNVVVPGAPLTPWADCDALIAAFFPS